MDYESLDCPNQRCRYYGVPFNQGLMIKNGSWKKPEHPQAEV